MSSGISTSKEQAGHGYPFVSFGTVFNNYFLPETITDLMNTSDKEQNTYSIKKDDILITRTSETIDELAMSCVALKDYPQTTYSGFTKRLRPKSGTTNICYSKYLAFYLRGYLFRNAVTNNAFMTLRASFNEDIFSFLNLYLPEYKQQTRIGNLLYSIEQKIQLNKKINAKLEDMAKTIYDYWFVQFDFPNAQGKPYRHSGGKMEYNETLKREIPKGWKVENLFSNSLASVIKPGVNLFKKKIYLATADVNNTAIGTGNLINYVTRESRANMQPTVNSVWFAKMKNSVKHLFLNKDMEYLINNSILSTGFCGLQCEENTFEYVASFISNSSFEIRKDTLAHGATQEAVNNSDLMQISIITPPLSVIENYHSKTKAFYSRISRCIQESLELTRLRDWLLPMLMNGQATVVDSDESLKNSPSEEKIINFDNRFELWLKNQGLAARGNIDRETLREIFDAMDDDDK